jgi:hypothetical protein
MPLVLLALHLFLIWRHRAYYAALFAMKALPE